MKHVPIFRALAFATGALAFATLLSYGGRWFWACDLLVNFRSHFALVLALVLLIAVAIRAWWFAALAGLALVLNLWPMQAALIRSDASPVTVARLLRLVEFNIYVGNRDLKGVAAYLDSLGPDVVVLEEVTPAAAERLTALLPHLPHRQLAVDPGVRGVMVLSRWPLFDSTQLVRDGRLFGLRTDVELGGQRLRLYGVHLDWPVLPASFESRNAQLSSLAAELASCRQACVVVGDFNTTTWSSHFRDLERGSGWRDCARGQGWAPTWPAALPSWLRIRIDQCLASDAVAVNSIFVGQAVGSDHLATINDLGFSGP
jgi:endonuclease/exonuclease/phosphatase (EEP) superfamily protein YafD